MSDETHPVVAAVLAVTPGYDPDTRSTIVGFTPEWEDAGLSAEGDYEDAEPIAAAQAAAVLRWAVYNCEELWPQADPLAWISRLADAIEPATAVVADGRDVGAEGAR